jgi:predicted double-glycine peptidase
MLDKIYSFVYKGHLSYEALDKIEGINNKKDNDTAQISERLSIKNLDDELVLNAKRMSIVYIVIASFENGIRQFVTKFMLEKYGATWWEQKVAEKIRTKVEGRIKEEQKNKWHTSRGLTGIYYTDFGDLGNIIGNNWDCFENYLPSIEWAKQHFDTLEKSRNVIMHSGELAMEDIERIGVSVRDWIKQVGA